VLAAAAGADSDGAGLTFEQDGRVHSFRLDRPVATTVRPDEFGATTSDLRGAPTSSSAS
jgi:hypothetical protein